MNYKTTNKPELIKGIKRWKNPNNRFTVLMVHYTADETKDPERDGSEWYNNERKGVPKADWEKEYEIDFTTRSGKLIYGSEFCDFNPAIHFIDSFEVPTNVELLLGLDFGQRNPTCALVGAWTRDNKLYIIDEYYKPALPSVSSREMFEKFGYLMDLPENAGYGTKRRAADSAFQIKVIDPTTQSKNRSKIKDGEEIPYSVIEEFYDNGWDFEPANNDVTAGITRVREYFAVDSSGDSHLYIFRDKCPNLCWELQHYRYKELTEQTEKVHNASEEPVKKDDHACLAGDSIIHTTNGDKKIKDLVGQNGYVYCYDEKRKRISVGEFNNVKKTGTKKIYKIFLDNGDFIKATEDHPFLLRGGDYIQVKDLNKGDSLMPFYKIIDSHGHTTIRLNNGERMFAHRLVYQDCIGELPEDNWKWNIHHKDEDKLNNNPDNLLLLSRADHCGLHAKNRKTTDTTRQKLRLASAKKTQTEETRKRMKPNWDEFVNVRAKKWHKSEDGKKWHEEHGKDCWKEENRIKRRKTKNCLECNKEFITEDGTGQYCSLTCKATHRRKSDIDNIERVCKTCGGTFIVNKYSYKKYCSPDCRKNKNKFYNHKVVRVELAGEEDVYNMYVEGFHNFACNEVIVHNCDTLKYLISTRPNNPRDAVAPLNKIQRDIQRLTRPKIYVDGWDLE